MVAIIMVIVITIFIWSSLAGILQAMLDSDLLQQLLQAYQGVEEVGSQARRVPETVRSSDEAIRR